jgi:glutathione S-transferase
MKLYYSPGTCSLAPHIVLHESGLPFTAVLASTKTHQLADGTDYYTINPKGYVPLLELDNGERLTEGPAITQYLADQVPARQLAPAAGTMARYRLMEWLNFITSELHKQYSPLFNKEMPEEAKALFRKKLNNRYAWLDGQLAGKPYLMGEAFTVADAYLFAVTNWSRHVGVDTQSHPNVVAYMARVAARPAVQAAMLAEGLLK